ncbi:hypothetical protein ES288_D10G284400v1 [Gossypium darwinii]|uniref:Factor of DNA methylation 1-5/IDN2 domain-containing protein n=1 Tax=Gossypium darwinii TaxID=34276 RepID=A0A5D2B303_GOSDA|nr:hypothetical protein ES288_D10G284400v1 [Gossypium darwinii]
MALGLHLYLQPHLKHKQLDQPRHTSLELCFFFFSWAWRSYSWVFVHLRLQLEFSFFLLVGSALKSSIEMENTNYDKELKNDRRLVCSLIYDINCRKEQLSQMEREYNEMTATLRGLINGLIAKINSKDSNLWGWELQYNVTMRQLKGKNAALRLRLLKVYSKKKKKKKTNGNVKPFSSQPKENVPCRDLVELEKTTSDQIAALKEQLEETSEALKDMESRYSCLTVKQILINRELQDARKESFGLNDVLTSRTTLVVKRMGEIDQKAFEVASSGKFPNKDWQETCAKLCSLWQQNVQDPKWHPFKMINIRGNLQAWCIHQLFCYPEIVDEDDEKLKELRNEYGDVVYEAVSTALMEMNEYNVSGRYAVI